MFQSTLYTSAEGLANGIIKVQPLTKCNNANTIQHMREEEIDAAGFHHYRPLKNEKYHFTLPNNKDSNLLFLLMLMVFRIG